MAESGASYGAILAHYYRGTTVRTLPNPWGTIRVGLAWDRAEITGHLSATSNAICQGGGDASAPAGDFAYRAEFLDGATKGILRTAAGVEILRCGGPMQVNYEPASLRVFGTEYRRGSFEMSVKPSSILVRAIANIYAVGASPAIDVYLWGLGEMPSSWPMEALKAQAGAGRTYALEKIQRLGQNRSSPACDCALVASTLDQAYTGYSKEVGASGARWISAVEGTRLQVVESGGKLIEAYYHSSSGGHTENNELQWGGSPRSYLRGVPDPWDEGGGNPHANWRVNFTFSDLEARLNADPVTRVGSLRSIEVVAPLGVSGRVIVYTSQGGGVRISGSSATARVSGDKLRSVLGLKSNLFSFQALPPQDSKTQGAGGYTLAFDGELIPFGKAPPLAGPRFIDFDIARAVTLGPNGKGYLLDGWGGIHPLAGAPGITDGPYWQGFDIARDIEVRADSTSGYLLDGWGGIHGFGGAPPVAISYYTEGQDLFRRLVLRDDGQSGYVVTASGRVAPFGGAPAVTWTQLPAGREAKGLSILPDGSSGYVLDNHGAAYAYGGTLPPAIARAAPPASGVVGFDQRRDGRSGYVVSDAGGISAFGSALPATSASSSSARRDVVALKEAEGYVLDGWGGLHSVGGAPRARGGPYWQGFDIGRALITRSDGSGYVLDGWGGIHPFGSDAAPIPPSVSPSGYWSGFDIARDIALIPGQETSGYVLDGWGGIHPFGGAPVARVSGYWLNWDIARSIVILPSGAGGYVLDGWGGIHPFAIGNASFPPPITIHPYWQGFDIGREFVLTSSTGGWVVDGWGGVHPFGSQGGGGGQGSWYWSEHDLVRGASSAGFGSLYFLDAYGGIHTAPLAAPAASGSGYWIGFPIARDIAMLAQP